VPSPNTSNFKRIAISVIGWICIIIGIVGLFLPVIQGILFLLVGLIILSTEYRWARKTLERMRSRLPRISAVLTKAHLIVAHLFARSQEKPKAPTQQP
jgi:uncharacterized protein YqgC (DUF456 family)